ncbi:MAG: site-2 protease family protein [Planctomycetaceae bacterium]|jgi:regulator of sigma E protease|nr:site-2 protease family protein [Planctomycetaceae bacterium]
MDFAITLLGIATQPTIFDTIINVTIKVLLVIAGINALIIVHEFGHFIVARLCGVRCEKFYIWFDFWGLKFFKFKWGDTEYGLGMFPLGGYVKMLGQEDNPGELKAELERAKLQKNQIAQDNIETDAKEPQTAKTPEIKQTNINIGGPDKPISISINISTSTSASTETRSAEELQEAIFAPDSYLAKSVPQRLAIIVAGVVMNFIFAIACAMAAYLVGVNDTAPVVGNVMPGSPAWEAGLQTGDRIKLINNNAVRAFMDVNMAVVGGADGVDLVIERNVDGTPQTLTKKFKPRKRPNDIAPMMGLNPCIKLDLLEVKKYPVDSNAKKFYSKEALAKLEGGGLSLTSIDGKPITGYGNYLEASLEKWGRPVEMTFAKNKTADNSDVTPASNPTTTTQDDKKTAADTKQITVTIPPIPVRETGVRFRMGEIVSVHPDSDAAKKGIKTGDVIVGIDDVEDFDPLKLSYIVLQKINAGQKSVRLKIKRNNESDVAILGNSEDVVKDVLVDGKGADVSGDVKDNVKGDVSSDVNGDVKVGDKIETVVVGLQPVRIIPQISLLSMQDPLGSTALGLAWEVEPVVAGYLSGASASARQIPVGSKIISVKLINSLPLLNKNSFSYVESDGVVFQDVGERVELPYILDYMLQLARTKSDVSGDGDVSGDVGKADESKRLSVQFEVIKPDGSNELIPVEVYESAEFFRVDRGLLMSEMKEAVKANNTGEAFVLGVSKTIEYSLAVYVTLKRFYDGTVSPRALGGPVLVVQSAYSFVSRGNGAYLLFLCIIGANLAVVNLLPMPPLDGGHVVFLIYEGIFRRPPNIIVQAILSWAGLILILLLGLWVIALDCSFIPRF